MKHILKKIFPIVTLKQLFLLYNKTKSTTWDRVIFSEYKPSSIEIKIYNEKNPFIELQIDVNSFDDQIKTLLERWTNPAWKQDEYIVEINTGVGYIEGKSGWGIIGKKKLIYPSLGFGRAPHVHKPLFVEQFLWRRKETHIPKLISLRDTGEENYFHFFNDVLPKLFFLRDCNFKVEDFKIIISQKLYDKHFFQYFLKHTFLSDLNWYVQKEDEWIRFNSALFCKPFTHTKKYFEEAVRLISNTEPSNNGDKRIFLTRSLKSLRYLENFDELLPILKKYNFKVVDASELTLVEQVHLFSECRYLVAIHGAGITNIIFRQGRPLSMLEIIQPSPYIPFHYIMMCKMYNYGYNAMIGTKGNNSGSGGFILEAKRLDNMLLKLTELC